MSNFELLNKARVPKSLDPIYGSDPSYGFTGYFCLIINGLKVKCIACDMEEWKPITGYKGEYEISTHGRVRSLARVVDIAQGGFRAQENAILKPNELERGYLRVTLRHDERHLVHTLVAQEFLPNPKSFKQINHRDCDKKNNLVTNLEWCTQEYNMHHAIERGVMEGWTTQQIEAIKAMSQSKLSCVEIAKLMNSSRVSISTVVNDRHRNLSPELPEPNPWPQMWQHVSVSIQGSTMTPSWAIMCKVKELFFEPEDCVVQYHPPKSEYVNTHPGVLHLWKPMNEKIPMPPKEFV